MCPALRPVCVFAVSQGKAHPLPQHPAAPAPLPPPPADGGGGGGFNWREWGDGFRRGASDFFKAVATLLLIGAVMVAVSLWQPLMAFLGALVRAIFRLDAGERAQRARGPPPPQADLGNKEGLGNVEASVISKYAAAEEDDDEGGESGEDEV